MIFCCVVDEFVLYARTWSHLKVEKTLTRTLASQPSPTPIIFWFDQSLYTNNYNATDKKYLVTGFPSQKCKPYIYSIEYSMVLTKY